MLATEGCHAGDRSRRNCPVGTASRDAFLWGRGQKTYKNFKQQDS